MDGTSAAAVLHVALNMAAQRCRSVHAALRCPSLSCCVLPTLPRPSLDAFNVAQASAIVEFCFAAQPLSLRSADGRRVFRAVDTVDTILLENSFNG